MPKASICVSISSENFTWVSTFPNTSAIVDEAVTAYRLQKTPKKESGYADLIKQAQQIAIDNDEDGVSIENLWHLLEERGIVHEFQERYKQLKDKEELRKLVEKWKRAGIVTAVRE